MGVRHIPRIQAVAVTATFLFLAFSTYAPTTSASHDDPDFQAAQIGAPHAAMMVTIEDADGNRSYRFSDVGRIPLGHLQWRDAVSVCCGSQHFGETYDLTTGLPVLEDSFQASTTRVGVDTRPDVWLEFEPARISNVDGHGYVGWWTGLDPAFPESVLWGRWAYSIPQTLSYELPRSPHDVDDDPPSVTMTYHLDDGTVYADMTTTVSYGHPYTLTVDTTMEVNATSGVALVREKSATLVAPDGTEHMLFERSETARVTDPGDDEPLPFEGDHIAPIYAGRDQTLAYGGFDMWPVEPEAHEWFDIAQAAALAWSLEDADLRAFKADAQDPHLANAGLRLDAGAEWTLRFVEANGRSATVELTGVKVPGGPFLVADADVEVRDRGWGHIARDARLNATFAAPADLAAAHDIALSHVTPQVTSYEWEVHGYGHHEPSGRLQTWTILPGPGHHLSVSTALDSGVVDQYYGDWTTVGTIDVL